MRPCRPRAPGFRLYRSEIGSYREGDILPVRYDPSNHTKIAVDVSALKARAEAAAAERKATAIADGVAKLARTAAPASQGREDAAGDLAPKLAALGALIKEHGAQLVLQPDDVRQAVVSDLELAGIDVLEGNQLRFTDPAQIDSAVQVYKRHSLLPPDATLGSALMGQTNACPATWSWSPLGPFRGLSSRSQTIRETSGSRKPAARNHSR